jgi:hypothetical protein
VVVKVLVIEEYAVFAVVPYLHVATSLEVTEREVEVVLAGKEEGVASFTTVGGVASAGGVKEME